MASEPEISQASLLAQLIRSRNRDLSLFMPLIMGFTSPSRRESDNTDSEEAGERSNDRIILVNPFTQGMIVIEGNRSLEALIEEVSMKEGLPPASRASIEAMPTVKITEEEIKDAECAICLEGWEICGEAKEMPCKHKYHSNCIEKWLEIHGSCPVCRFKMPVDEEENKKRGRDEERRERISEREIWVTFSFNNRSNSSRTDSNTNSTVRSDDSLSSSRSVDDSALVYDGSSSNEEI